jgi:hypothetical protein
MAYVAKALGIFVLAVLCLALVLVGGLNLAKFPIYSEYYSIEETICTNPGLNDGFVCQGICVSEENGVILVSGYMADKSNSRIYVTDFESNSYYVELTREGKKYTGHAGGIALTGDTVYISNGSKLYVFSLSDVLSAKNGDIVDIGAGTTDIAVITMGGIAQSQSFKTGSFDFDDVIVKGTDLYDGKNI